MSDVFDLDFLAARQYAYMAFQRLLGDRPTADLFAALDVDVLREALAIVGAAEDAADALAVQVQAAPEKLDELDAEYARVFVGPKALPAPPWESVYVGKRRLIMTEDTLAVRNAYRAQGLEPELGRHVPDDHIAIELDFLASLATRALEAAQQGDAETCSKALEASAGFLGDHLCAWIDDFIADLEAHADSAFYTAVARAVSTTAAADRDACR